MQINSVGASAPTNHLPQAVARAGMIGNAESGYLTRSDMKMLKAVTGQEFNWPPKEGDGFPMAAAELAAYRQRQMIANSPIAELTAKDLTALQRRGLLEASCVDDASDYLQGKQPATSTAAGAATGPADPTISAGHRTGDGRYL